MIQNIVRLLLIFCSLLFASSCYQDNKHHDKARTDVHVNIDEDFGDFLVKFSTDSLFQLSRVKFPLSVSEIQLADNAEMKVKVVAAAQYPIIHFITSEIERSVSPFTQTIKYSENNTTVEIRGIESGLNIDYFFERINEKWLLVAYIDSST